MRHRGSRRSAAVGRACAWIAVLLLALPGCSRRQEHPAPAGSQADTLSNGVPRALVPQLTAWIEAWRHAAPGFGADSLARAGAERLAFSSARPGADRRLDPAREGASIVVLSPDSSRALDFDAYLEFGRNDAGAIELLREPDSAPTLADFERDTTWQVAFCGTPCFYDGAYWLDAERFALTGATQTGAQADGPWCPFLEIYDLRAGRLERWQGAPVESGAFERFIAAGDSALIARLEAATRLAGRVRPREAAPQGF